MRAKVVPTSNVLLAGKLQSGHGNMPMQKREHKATYQAALFLIVIASMTWMLCNYLGRGLDCDMRSPKSKDKVTNYLN